jgi:hypothetical protein
MVKAGEQKAHKPAHSKAGQEVSAMLGKDHAILEDRSPGMRREMTTRKGDLQKALKEAVSAGIAARKAETARLLEKAKREGWSQEDICGWTWIDIDPGTCRSVMLLGMEGTRVTFSLKPPKFVSEDHRLHLDDVNDHQRFWASMKGIKAAAEVLKRRGIRAEAKGEPD